MKRANHLLPQIEDMDNLYLAFWKASKGKRYASSVLSYQEHLDMHLLALQQDIGRGDIALGDYRYFYVFEPKKREICASAFREQVFHHALMNVCHDHFDRVQIFDSYASRKGKGTYAALDRARRYTRKYEWFLKMDVRKFFASIHHRVLKKHLAHQFKEKRLLGLFDQIIDSYVHTHQRGLPIGNLTSQYFANHYLCGLDHFIKEDLRCKAYVRYMDDMVLWANEKATLTHFEKAILEYVSVQLRLQLKPTQLNRTRLGLPFLGYRLHPYFIRLLGKSRRRFIRKLKNIQDKMSSGAWDQRIAKRHVLPLLAFTEHADACTFRQQVLEELRFDIVGL